MKFSCSWFIVILAGALWITAGASAAPPVVALGPGVQSIEIAPFSESYLDTTESLQLDDALQGRIGFQPHDRQSFGFAFKRGTLWIRALIQPLPPGPEGEETYLVFNNGGLGSVTLYVPVHGTGPDALRVMQGGWQDAGAIALESFISPSFRLPADYDATRPLLISVTTPYTLQFGVTLLSQRAFVESSLALFLFLGLCMGILLSMLLYNLFLYSSIRDRHYLFYVLFVFSQLLFHSIHSYTNLSRFLWPQSVGYFMPYIPMFSALAVSTLILFLREFLETRHNTPRHDRVLQLLLLTAAVITGLVLFDYQWEANILAYFLLQAVSVIQFTVAIAAIRAGFKPATFFLVAVSAFLLGVLIYVLRLYGIVPNNGITIRAAFFGVAVETILFSFAVGYRIRVLKQEHQLALERAKNLRLISITDALTQLYNRRYFDESIEEQIREARQHEHPLSLLMIDVDHFKSFNDRYGHPEGDHVLAALGSVIRSSVREQDIACRYGGEEFAVIVHEADAATAAMIAERIRERFAALVFGPVPDTQRSVTVSLGLTCYRPHEAVHELLSRCDAALYRAKTSGRDRAVQG